MRRQAVGSFLGRSLVGEYRKIGWSTRTATPVLALLRDRRARVEHALRNPQALTAAGDMPPVDPFGQTTWADDLANSLEPQANGVYAEISEAGYQMFAPADARGVLSRVDMTDQLQRLVGRMEGLGTDSANAIGTTLTQGFARGESYSALAGRVQDVFGSSAYRSEMIARTEVTRAVEGVNNDYAGALASTGLVMVKQWLDSENACEECVLLALEGSVPYDAAFSDGNTEPPAHPNCRCSVAYDTEGGPVVSELGGGPYPEDSTGGEEV